MGPQRSVRVPFAKVCRVALALLSVPLLTAERGASAQAPRACRGSTATCEVRSPDGRLLVRVRLEGGVPRYDVEREGEPVLVDSAFGVRVAPGFDYGSGLEVVGERRESKRTAWPLVWGQSATALDAHESLEVSFASAAPGAPAMRLEVRAFDDGFGLRYVFPSPGALTFTDDLTEFAFAREGRAWWTIADFDGDESGYNEGALSSVETANTPFTARLPSGLHVAVHEASLVDFSAMTLEARRGRPRPTLGARLVPARKGDPLVKAEVRAPFATPWRTIHVVARAGDLATSNLVLNLNEPCAICAGPTDWIRPAKYAGVWWEIHKGLSLWEPGPFVGATTGNTKRYMDFAAAHGLSAVLAEGWNVGWRPGERMDYIRPQPSFDLDAVLAHGASKGVGFIAHMETNADVANLEAQLDAAFAEYRRRGIRIVKTGYVGSIPDSFHYGQRMVNHYRMVLRKAAAHGIMVIAHEPVKPTGEQRTFPNYLGAEGFRGTEWDAWSEGNPASHTVTLPFTRGLGGPMDYTPGLFRLAWFPERLASSPFASAPRGRSHSTRARQLALYVLLTSGAQMLADLPEHYEGEKGLDFLEAVPVTWDESRVLYAAVGDLLVIARRKGTEWYLGAGTDETPRVARVPLGFLGAGSHLARIYRDPPGTDADTAPDALLVEERVVSAADAIELPLASGGGAAVRLTPR